MSYVVTTNRAEGAHILAGAQPFDMTPYLDLQRPRYVVVAGNVEQRLARADYDDQGGRQRTIETPDRAVWREYDSISIGQPDVYSLAMLRLPLIVASWRGTTVSTHQHGNITEAEYNAALEEMYPTDWQGWTFAWPEPYTTAYGLQFRYYFTATTENNQRSWRVALSTRRFKNESLGLAAWFAS
jgi:hypothetical protein